MAQFVFDNRLKAVLMAGLVVGLSLTSGRESATLPLLICTWLLAAVAIETLWHPAVDKTTIITMAPAIHLAALVALPLVWGIPTVTVSAALGAVLWRRGKVTHVAARAGCTLAGSLAAIAVLVPSGTHSAALAAGLGAKFFLLEIRYLLFFLLSGVAYLVLSQGLASVRAARTRRVSWFRAWREVFGKETEIVMSVALITVSLLVLFCYEAIGYRGILLCVMPVLFIRDGSRRNIELQAAQIQLIENERLAAKGEMAAEIGHELNNYLAAISGRAQLLLRKLGPESSGPLNEEASRVRSLAVEMAELAKGLMEFSGREAESAACGINELIEKTVEFVRPQARFRAMDISFQPGSLLPSVEMDPGQIQQVLLTLFGRVADGGGADATARAMRIRTFRDEPGAIVGIEIQTPGVEAGAPGEEQGADKEHTLQTVRRVLERYQGSFEASDQGDRGETYRVLLPAA